MGQDTYSLAWESHRNNICNGLTAFQQNGEFVDMTLAADGHHVKVHQMVMAMASPYIKELISSANCPHPIIFLNKISLVTLSAILEYIYTGEVLVSMDNLSDLLVAAKELHIKGLEEMNIGDTSQTSKEAEMANDDKRENNADDEICYFEVGVTVESPTQKKNYLDIDQSQSNREDTKSCMDESTEDTLQDEEMSNEHESSAQYIVPEQQNSDMSSTMQYTISNQGSLQMILNRYVYYLKHSNRNKSRQWRCVDYLNRRKCPALVFTQDDVVLQRISAHTHPFHDKRILNKVHAGAVYTAISEAENQGNRVKNKCKTVPDDSQ